MNKQRYKYYTILKIKSKQKEKTYKVIEGS